MRRRYPIAVSAAALGAAAAALAPAGTTAQAPDALTLEARYKEAKVSLVDLPPKMTRRRRSESPGDMAVGRGILRDASGAVAGRSHQAFTTTGGRGDATTEQVTATFVLGDGDVMLQGVSDNRDPDAPLVLAIAGGTGRYEGAAGSATVTQDRTAVRFALRFVR